MKLAYGFLVFPNVLGMSRLSGYFSQKLGICSPHTWG